MIHVQVSNIKTDQIISEKKSAGFKLRTESRSRSDGFGKVKMLDFWILEKKLKAHLASICLSIYLAMFSVYRRDTWIMNKILFLIIF